ncbi:MAG: bifunctional precorrin-2 dehydrogenase/sirohydrochlorin ferrochelatase [Synergistaceae bacterium]|jgi:precorrin-2 dehydrogenase/sirohydrochlorin ferrochelatase/precorrin-6A/cobalt-precorrin-6A reductase|nr:bifunctional precorrin-2 dehydrogenase/sirohydrochlorin ferrochelatase [Synergistaceae bacterium]
MSCRESGPPRDVYPCIFPLFPFFMNIAGRKALVIGGGSVALRRTRALLTCGATVTVISPEFHEDFSVLSQIYGENLRLVKKRIEKVKDLDFAGVFIAVLATNNRELNRDLGEQARKAGILVSVSDAPEECSFFFPALVTEGEVAVAVSAGGCPSLTRRLSDRLRAVWSGWVQEAKRGEVIFLD